MNSVALAPSVSANGAENTRLIILISSVATIGGFLFGFDSGVINGTVDGLQQCVSIQFRGYRLRRRVDAARLRDRRHSLPGVWPITAAGARC
jgi:hypothetical protein